MKNKLMMLAVILLVTGCNQLHDSTDYDRHTMSRISKHIKWSTFASENIDGDVSVTNTGGKTASDLVTDVVSAKKGVSRGLRSY